MRAQGKNTLAVLASRKQWAFHHARTNTPTLFTHTTTAHLCRACSRDSNAAKGKVSYNAHPKDYIKQSVLAHLQRQAGGGGGGGGGSGGGRRH